MKQVFLFAILAMTNQVLLACDICGCGVGGGYLGILPEFQKNIAGVRYRYNSLLTDLGAGGSTTYLTTREHYQTMEIWAGITLAKKIRLMPVLPYSFNSKTNQGVTSKKSGLGDASVTGYYLLLNKTKTTDASKLLVQSLWIGGGVKLPTGRYNPADKQNTNRNANLFQLGTGSLDFTLNGMYDVRLQDAGWNLSANYKINTVNKYDYQYGNRLSSSTQFYYKFRIKKVITVAPSIGAGFETAAKDFDDHFPVAISGGNILLGTLGFELLHKKFSAGGNWQTPLSQQLANGAVQANNRMMIHASVLF